LSLASKIEPDRYANTGFSIKDTPQELNEPLFHQMMQKTGAERLAIGCQMNTTARQLVWSGIPKSLPVEERRELFLRRFYGPSLE
jgi:hypothetical protein